MIAILPTGVEVDRRSEGGTEVGGGAAVRAVSRIFNEARFIENSPTHGALWVDAPSVDSAQVQFGMKRRFGNPHRWISGWGGAGGGVFGLKNSEE